MSEQMRRLLETQRDYFTPAEVAAVLCAEPHAIRILAREHPERLKFPVLVIGNRVKIPRQPFLKFMGIDDPMLQERSEKNDQNPKD